MKRTALETTQATCEEETRHETPRRLRPTKKTLAVKHLDGSDLRGRDKELSCFLTCEEEPRREEEESA